MKPNKIKSLLIMAEIKQKTLAEELDVTFGTVSRVISRQTTSKRIREHIANRLQLPYERVWGKAA